MKINTFNLSRNTKPHSDTSAPYTGSVNIDGKEYWLNGFINDSADGSKYFGGYVNPKKPRADADKPPLSPQDAVGDDDIPF